VRARPAGSVSAVLVPVASWESKIDSVVPGVWELKTRKHKRLQMFLIGVLVVFVDKRYSAQRARCWCVSIIVFIMMMNDLTQRLIRLEHLKHSCTSSSILIWSMSKSCPIPK
jgi:hypothetical protein